MVFECQSVWNWDDIDELVSDYPCLKDYNVRSVVKTSMNGTYYRRIEIDIDSLEELIELSKKVDNPLIVKSKELCIEIYDGYRE